jgi:hypothetical protein
MDTTKYKRPQFSLRVVFLLVTILALLLWLVPIAYDSWTAVPTRALEDAVDQFNIDASLDDIGALEPPLTVKEVLAAIRADLPTPNARTVFTRIVKTQQIPTTASLNFTTGYDSGSGSPHKVWWINLNVMTGKNTGYTLRVRDRDGVNYLNAPSQP